METYLVTSLESRTCYMLHDAHPFVSLLLDRTHDKSALGILCWAPSPRLAMTKIPASSLIREVLFKTGEFCNETCQITGIVPGILNRSLRPEGGLVASPHNRGLGPLQVSASRVSCSSYLPSLRVTRASSYHLLKLVDCNFGRLHSRAPRALTAVQEATVP